MNKILMKSVLQKAQITLQREFDKTMKQLKEHKATLTGSKLVNDNHVNTLDGKLVGLLFSMNMVQEMAEDLKAGKPISEWGKKE
jgi:hypothetical protein